jgi:hypothetical protein
LGRTALPEIERQQAQGKEVVFRGDAAGRTARPEAGVSIQKFSLSGSESTMARRVVAKVEFRSGELFPASASS